MIKANEIADALPDISKADKLLDKYLKEHSRPIDPRFSPERYFNNTKTKYLNVAAPFQNDVVTKLKKKKGIKELVNFLNKQWNSNVFEKMVIAAKVYEFVDLSFSDFENLIKKVDNWAHCDNLCGWAIGKYMLNNPEQIPKLKKWAKSKNKWERRCATVSLIQVLKDEKADKKEALKILDMLMTDNAKKEVMAATDWMIREHSKKHLKEGYEYCKKWALYYKKTGNKDVRWVLVRAIKKLTINQQKEIGKIINLKVKS